ncbi:MAG TPA: GAF domain-containing protein [Chloroflexi bacterium]|nr:GAF domain-containing protein [Chloroflexota bacterium]
MRKETDLAAQGELAYRLPHLTWVGQMLLILRWLALLLVLVLSLFDHLEEGLLVSPLHAVLGMAVYNLALLFVSRYVRWLRRPLNFLALDTLVATLATYLTGGYHSGFFILYISNIVGAAFYMDLVPTILVALAAGLIYTGACAVNPAGVWTPIEIYIVAAKLLLLLVIAVLCALLLEQLRREHQETERERVLVTRLSALNELFRQLSISLDLQHVLRTVVTASCHLLEADVAVISLIEEDGHHLRPAAAHGIDTASLAHVRWPVEDELMATMLETGQPYVFTQSSSLPERYHVLPTPVRHEDIACGISVPMLLQGQPIGFLEVVHRKPHDYSAKDLMFLSALGQQAAIAVCNARLYQREREQVRQLRTLEQLQRSFISTISHELRTPLTCIKTSVDLLRDTALSVQTELLDTIAHHTGRLEALVADLLESTRLETGQITLATQPTDLRRIVERTVTAVAPLMEGKKQYLEITLPDEPVSADVDRRRIEQALTNLLSNAHKFTPKSGHIRVTLKRRDDELVIAVADDGPGIPREQQERLFQRFYVIPDGTGKVGLGLGLHITRQLVELHGGHVWVESEPRQGSTFFIALPVLEGERA